MHRIALQSLSRCTSSGGASRTFARAQRPPFLALISDGVLRRNRASPAAGTAADEIGRDFRRRGASFTGRVSSARRNSYKFLRRRQIEGGCWGGPRPLRERDEAGDEVISAIWRVLINGISYCSTSFRRAGVLLAD